REDADRSARMEVADLAPLVGQLIQMTPKALHDRQMRATDAPATGPSGCPNRSVAFWLQIARAEAVSEPYRACCARRRHRRSRRHRRNSVPGGDRFTGRDDPRSGRVAASYGSLYTAAWGADGADDERRRRGFRGRPVRK